MHTHTHTHTYTANSLLVRTYLHTNLYKHINTHVHTVLLQVDPWCVLTQDVEGRSPLHLAALQGSLEMCKLLFDKKPERVQSKHLIAQMDKKKVIVCVCTC